MHPLAKWQPRDLIALFVMAGGYWLLSKGIDSWVTATMTLIIGYYFGRRKDNEVA